jgi:hypothetical protein
VSLDGLGGTELRLEKASEMALLSIWAYPCPAVNSANLVLPRPSENFTCCNLPKELRTQLAQVTSSQTNRPDGGSTRAGPRRDSSLEARSGQLGHPRTQAGKVLYRTFPLLSDLDLHAHTVRVGKAG